MDEQISVIFLLGKKYWISTRVYSLVYIFKTVQSFLVLKKYDGLFVAHKKRKNIVEKKFQGMNWHNKLQNFILFLRKYSAVSFGGMSFQKECIVLFMG